MAHFKLRLPRIGVNPNDLSGFSIDHELIPLKTKDESMANTEARELLSERLKKITEQLTPHMDKGNFPKEKRDEVLTGLCTRTVLIETPRETNVIAHDIWISLPTFDPAPPKCNHH